MKLVLALALSVLASVSTHAEPVRVAVVGFTGDLTGEELTSLAISIRGSLTRQADPKALIVVSREEMAAVYEKRGAPCRPDDVGCIAEASDAWAGRLFVRGVVRKTSDGIIVGATLESVRGILVTASQTPPSPKWDMGVVVPILVRELLDGERAYRARMDAAAAAPVQCKCMAIASTAVPGTLVADDDGVHFDTAPASVAKVSWRYGWDRVLDLTAKSHGVNPAMSLLSSSNETLTVYFNLGDDRDNCLAAIERRRALHRHP